ncbi:SCO2583/SCO2584 N-terminal domain-containing protein [Actinomadura rudentiformis]|uniref:Uncharacterized protein n=1 Tax=Actinomadura rudentiformis TaxID=359158 RepID=A0A6H9YQP9_9ACTN|nr:hypothetical protein [Actinomadura rudentiformis]KAB2343280.1 hypothetical protein F8566_34590 [Actinomadura rudentiformis]
MAPDPDQPVFDEDFVKGAAFTEPSAQERGRAPGRLEQKRSRRRTRRAERKAEKLLYGGSPSGSGYRATGRTKAAAYVLIGAVLVAVVGGAVWEQTLKGDGSGSAPQISISELERSPGISTGPSLNPADPFAGSPAASYADGEAGIEMPVPTAMNGLSASDLTSAYGLVKQTIAAANLEPRVVFKNETDPFTRLLQPDQRDDVRTSLKSKGDGNLRSWMSMFAPGTAEQVGTVIKVNGAVKASKATRQGNKGVLVKSDHNFVYAVQRPGKPDTLMRVVVRRTHEIFLYREDGKVMFWQYESGRSPAPAECDTKDGYIHPSYPEDRGGEDVQPSGEPLDPYDMSRAPDYDRGCGRVQPV